MAFVKTINSTFFINRSSHLNFCPQRRPRSPFYPSLNSFKYNPIRCKADHEDTSLDIPDESEDNDSPSPTDFHATDAAVLARSEQSSIKATQQSQQHKSADDDADQLSDSPKEVTETTLELGGGAMMKDVTQTEAEVCLGEFMTSKSLDEYNERRNSDDFQSSRSFDAEWTDTWALGVGDRKGIELQRQYARVGVLIEQNFSDFVPSEGCTEAFRNATIEEIAAVKARAIYQGTGGLPSIAEMTEMSIDPPESGSRINKSLQQGYYTKNIEEEAEIMIEKVRPISDENRLIHFRSVAVYFDGENEIITEKVVHVVMIFANSGKSLIATSAALDEMYKELSKKFGLTLTSEANRGFAATQGWGESSPGDGKKGKVLIGATLLRERIMREGKVLGDGIIKVSSFMNHMVDTDLMEVCGEELAERLRRTMPNKVLTVESTGLVAGLPTARTLGIPLVFARKSRPITISDSYQTSYKSSTKGITSELIVSCEYLESGDRVVIIDDFLAGGSTAEALFKLARMAHAKVVGVGVLIEKLSDGGRAFLSGYDVPVESLAKVSTDESGRITIEEEKAWKPAHVKRVNEDRLREQTLRAKEEYYSRVEEKEVMVPLPETEGGNDAKEVKLDLAVGAERSEDDSGDEDADEAAVDVIRWEDAETLDDIEEDLVRRNSEKY